MLRAPVPWGTLAGKFSLGVMPQSLTSEFSLMHLADFKYQCVILGP